MSMKPDMCIHYTGALNEPTCKAGVNYRELVGGPVAGWVTRLPCTSMEPREGRKAECERLCLPTAEQVAESKRQSDEYIRRFMAAYTGKVAEWRQANEWNHRAPKGATGIVSCEVCGTGQIHLSMAAYNGHVHGKCTTPDCISWME